MICSMSCLEARARPRGCAVHREVVPKRPRRHLVQLAPNAGPNLDRKPGSHRRRFRQTLKPGQHAARVQTLDDKATEKGVCLLAGLNKFGNACPLKQDFLGLRPLAGYASLKLYHVMAG